MICLWVFVFFVLLDDICDYFGVKIAMYFAWLGFYTTSMLYPAVIGFVLWMLTESDQVFDHLNTRKVTYQNNNRTIVVQSTIVHMIDISVAVLSDQQGYLLCGVCSL